MKINQRNCVCATDATNKCAAVRRVASVGDLDKIIGRRDLLHNDDNLARM